MVDDSVSIDPSQLDTSGIRTGEQFLEPIQIAARRSLTTALELAGAGYALTPVTITRLASGKKSARFHKGWRHEHAWSCDPDQVKAWWLDHDGCSFALGGAANGIEGVDLDVKPGADGEIGVDAVSWWASRGLPLGALTQITPSGGRHLIWKASPHGPGLPQEAGKSLGRGVDTRNRSGLFFAAGAYVLGLDGKPEHGHYEVDGPLPALAELAPTPSEVIELFANASRDQQAERERIADGRIVVKDREWVRAETAKARATIVEHDREAGGYRAKIQHLGMFYGRVVELGELTAQAAEDDWRSIHSALWGPVVFDENVKDFRDALRDGPALERWRYRETEPVASSAGSEYTVEQDAVEQDAVSAVELEIRAEHRRLQVREQARRRFERESRPPDPGPSSTSLNALLVEPDESDDYRIGRLWPTDGKVLMSAPPKAGKTTLVGNLVRSLADGVAFLASPVAPGDWKVAASGFPVTPLAQGRRVFVLDFEMTRKLLRRWYRELRLAHPDAVQIEEMRGRRWDPRDDVERASWVAHLRALDVEVLIIDPIGPVLQSLGVEENSPTEVGAVLTALDMLKREAGISELFVVQHTGHAGERARGASNFLGWPDAIWYLTRDEISDARALRAEGRDVFLPETVLAYDRVTRSLALGQGNRVSARYAGDAEIVADIVRDAPGCTGRDIRTAARDTELGHKSQRAQDAIAAARAAGLVHVHDGPRRAQNHYAGPCDPECYGLKFSGP